jgi:hypothetical protein
MCVRQCTHSTSYVFFLSYAHFLIRIVVFQGQSLPFPFFTAAVRYVRVCTYIFIYVCVGVYVYMYVCV